ncbi:MAG: hypothetical protein SNJ09_04445 [Rikenellaceae bacterium]
MTAQEFIFNIPLYRSVSFDDISDPQTLAMKGVKIDGYNSFQKKESTYIVIKGLGDYYVEMQGFSMHSSPTYPITYYGNYSAKLLENTCLNSIVLKCERYDDRFEILVHWDVENHTITKVGQYPSIADMHIGQIKQYNKVLSKEQMREFTKGIGLAANGVGVGSFVYLRRIFEGLIFDTAQEMITNGELDKTEFDKSRMDEKINLIKDYLPDFLVENRSIYGILSKGIHELSEKECLGYFDVMRQSIELILDEKLDALRKEEKKKKAIGAISLITAKLKTSDDNN